MAAAQLAVDCLATEVPEYPAARDTAKAALLSLLLHVAAVVAIAGVTLQPDAPHGETIFTVELVSGAVAAAGMPQSAAAPASKITDAAEASVPPPAAGPEPQVVPPKAEPPVEVAAPAPDAAPLVPEPVAVAAPMPETKPRAPPQRPGKLAAAAGSETPPAPTPQAPAPAAPAHAEASAAAPALASAVAASAPMPAPQGIAGQFGEAQAVSAPAGSSQEPPVITEPRFRSPPRPPEYPPRARAMEQQGVSVVRALVDTDGTSREIRLWRSSGFDALDRAALVAVRGWRFEAARRGEQPVLAWVEIPIRFELR